MTSLLSSSLPVVVTGTFPCGVTGKLQVDPPKFTLHSHHLRESEHALLSGKHDVKSSVNLLPSSKSSKTSGSKLLVSVVPKNIFRHSSIGDLKKSVTINLEFQHPSKTLEDKDVNLIINEIINVVSKNFNAKLRQ